MVGRYPIFQFTNNGVIQLHIAREGSGSGGKFPDPDPAKRSGSDRIRIRNPGHSLPYLFPLSATSLPDQAQTET